MKFVIADRKHNKNDVLDEAIPDRSVEKPKFTPSYREIAKRNNSKKKNP